MRAITSKPLACKGLISYRCKVPFGYIMIGAKNDEDAFLQAKRSNENAKKENLEIMNYEKGCYEPCSSSKAVFLELQD